jgi:hypothetical protein
LNDVSGTLSPHCGQHGLRHGDGPEKICLELEPQFVEFYVFSKAGYGESGIIDEASSRP